MDNDLIDRVRYYYVNGGNWHAEAAYAAKVLGADVLDVVAAALNGRYDDDDLTEAYEDGYYDGLNASQDEKDNE